VLEDLMGSKTDVVIEPDPEQMLLDPMANEEEGLFAGEP
jgi:hypothetical protein